MPINLSNLKNDKRTVTAHYFGDECGVTYRPSELTPTVESAIRDAEGNTVLVDTLCKLIVAWEVMGDDGQPLPIEPDTLGNLPSAFLGAILQACRDDMLPKSKNGRR
jgi:hypothetical protein